MKDVADEFQVLNLEPEEVSARQRAVTMVEADLPPRVEDEWSFSTGPDRQLVIPDVEEMEEMRSIFDDPSTTNQSTDHPATHTEAMDVDDPKSPENGLQSLLHPGDTEHVNPEIAAPPIKPRFGSNPRIEVTPSLNEERESRISHVFIIPEQPNMDVEDTNLTNDVFRPPPDTEEDEQLPAVQITDTEVHYVQDAAPIVQLPADGNPHQPAAVEREESPRSMELSPVKAVPKKRKRKAAPCIHVDQETQIPGDRIKAQMENYDDLLRPKEDEAARIQRPRTIRIDDRRIVYPRRLAKYLQSLFMDAQKDAANTGGYFDWEEEDHPQLDLSPDVAPEVPAQDVSEMRDESNIRRESFNESSVLNPQGTMHSTMVEEEAPSTAKPPGDTKIRMEDIQEEPDTGHLVSIGHLQPLVVDQIGSPPRGKVVDIDVESITDPAPLLPGNITNPEEDHTPAATGGNITFPTGYEEFSQGLSQRNLEAGTVDEGFDETTSTSAFGEALRVRIGERKEGRLSDLVDDNATKKDVAKTFLQMLVANKQKKVEVSQEDCYDEIKFKVT